MQRDEAVTNGQKRVNLGARHFAIQKINISIVGNLLFELRDGFVVCVNAADIIDLQDQPDSPVISGKRFLERAHRTQWILARECAVRIAHRQKKKLSLRKGETRARKFISRAQAD